MAIEELLSGRLSGKSLALVAQAVKSPRLAALGADVLRRELGLVKLEHLEGEADTLDTDLTPRAARPPRSPGGAARDPAAQGPLESPVSAAWVTSAEALTRAYRERTTTPLQLIERVLAEADALARRQAWLRCLLTRQDDRIRREAQASAERYARGAPLGPLDGVPYAVKEHVAIQGLPCRAGHDLPSDEPWPRDATIVARLREAGAILLGHTTMTELGMSPIGVNPKRPALRNPHHVERSAGGSSTGSAIAVSLGLMPFAVGTDGGGSVRVPAAICGVFGMKPSFGRVSRGGVRLADSVSHVGPIASSTLDLARFLDAVCGPDEADPATLRAPLPSASFAEATRRRVRGLSLGVDERELRDADPVVAAAVEQSIRALETCGVRLVELKLPLAAHAFAIGSLTIISETHAEGARDFASHAAAFGFDMQVFMSLTEQLSAKEYLRAQRLRERLRRDMVEVLRSVDAIALPSTQSTALPVSEREERYGRVDTRGARAMCRYAFLANLTGLPAASAPVGLDGEGLPIGLQLLGDAWDEHTLLALSAELERIGAARPARPPYHVELLA
jgi:aspartyl-tRNA(Asn)/glutamyl-tRNA(Gln) amidotransferase subunit A